MRKAIGKWSKAIVIGLSLSLFLVGCNGSEGKKELE